MNCGFFLCPNLHLHIRISAGSSIDVGIAGTLTLDASNSRDPDDPGGINDLLQKSTFSWRCYDGDDRPCFEINPRTNTPRRVILPDGIVVTKPVAEFLNVNQS